MNTSSRLITALALAALLVPLATARQIDPAWTAQSRAIAMTHGSSGFQFDSIRQPEADDLLRGAFSLSTGEFRFSYVSFQEGNESLLQWEMAPLALVEYQDNDRNGRLDVGEEVLRRVPLRDLAGAAVLVEPDGLEGYRATIRYPFNATRPGLLPVIDPTQRGELEVRLGIPARPRSIGAVEMPASILPLEFEVERYPFNSSGTSLALEVRLGSNREFRSGAGSLSSGDGPYESTVAWAAEVRRGGVRAPAGITILDAPGEPGDRERLTLYASYGQGERLTHELTTGVTRYQAEGVLDGLRDLVLGDWRFYTVGFLAAGAVTFGAAWRRLRSA